MRQVQKAGDNARQVQIGGEEDEREAFAQRDRVLGRVVRAVFVAAVFALGVLTGVNWPR